MVTAFAALPTRYARIAHVKNPRPKIKVTSNGGAQNAADSRDRYIPVRTDEELSHKNGRDTEKRSMTGLNQAQRGIPPGYKPREAPYPAIHYSCAPHAETTGFPFERKIPWGRADLRS